MRSEDNLQVGNNNSIILSSNSSKKVILRCEVFAESFDKDLHNLSIKSPIVFFTNEKIIHNTSESVINDNDTIENKVNLNQKDDQKNFDNQVNLFKGEDEVKHNEEKRKLVFKVKNDSNKEVKKKVMTKEQNQSSCYFLERNLLSDNNTWRTVI